jgi:hypothetical protein
MEIDTQTDGRDLRSMQLSWYIYTKFRKDWFKYSEADSGKHRQDGDCNILYKKQTRQYKMTIFVQPHSSPQRNKNICHYRVSKLSRLSTRYTYKVFNFHERILSACLRVTVYVTEGSLKTVVSSGMTPWGVVWRCKQQYIFRNVSNRVPEYSAS